MTDGTRSDASAGAGRPGGVVLYSAMAEARQWVADPDTDVALVGTLEQTHLLAFPIGGRS
jgi:hypothetical protein